MLHCKGKCDFNSDWIHREECREDSPRRGDALAQLLCNFFWPFVLWLLSLWPTWCSPSSLGEGRVNQAWSISPRFLFALPVSLAVLLLLLSALCICISLWRWSWLQVQWQQIDKFNYGQRLLHLHLHSAFFMLCSNWAIELSTHSAAASSGWSSCNADSIGNLLLKYILFD